MSDHGDQVQLVDASYHQLYLAPLDVWPTLEGHALGDGRPTTPLAIVTDSASALVIFTGCADGPVQLHGRLHQTPPPVTDGDWEARKEISMVIREPLVPFSPTASGWYEPVLTAATPGRYRVRVSARGRGADNDFSDSEPSEWYLVDFWPADT